MTLLTQKIEGNLKIQAKALVMIKKNQDLLTISSIYQCWGRSELIYKYKD